MREKSRENDCFLEQLLSIFESSYAMPSEREKVRFRHSLPAVLSLLPSLSGLSHSDPRQKSDRERANSTEAETDEREREEGR